MLWEIFTLYKFLKSMMEMKLEKYSNEYKIYRLLMTGKNNTEQTHSCARDWRLLSSWGPDWGLPETPCASHHPQLGDCECIFFQSGSEAKRLWAVFFARFREMFHKLLESVYSQVIWWKQFSKSCDKNTCAKNKNMFS